MSDNDLTRGGSPVERPAGASSYGPCGAPSCTMAWVATVRMLEVDVERLHRVLAVLADGRIPNPAGNDPIHVPSSIQAYAQGALAERSTDAR